MNIKNNQLTYSNHSYIDFVSDAGTASVNVARKEVIFRHHDLEIGDGTFKLSLSHIHSNFNHINSNKYGLNWKLNIEQYLYKYDGSISLTGFNVGDYVYIDEDGYIHQFIKYDNTKYIEQNGNGLILNTEAIPKIEFPNGSYLLFNSDGQLFDISTMGTEKVTSKTIEFENGYITKFYDYRNATSRYFNFTYENSLLKKVELFSDNEVIESVLYEYSISKKLQGIYHYVNGYLKQVSLFNYNGDNLIYCTGTGNGLSLSIDYTDEVIVKKGISKIRKKGNSSSDNIPPIIGEGTTEIKYGSFVVDVLEDGVIYLGEEKIASIIKQDLGEPSGYEAYDLSNISFFERTDFTYYNAYSNIISNKNIKYRYYYNTKGFITGAFELDGDNKLLTLTKDNGISLTGEVVTSYNGETINRKYMCSYNGFNRDIECMNIDGVSSSYDGGPKLKDYRLETGPGYNYLNYVVSFWVKVNCGNASYMKFRLKVDFNNSNRVIKKEVFIDHTANGAWQYVTIPLAMEKELKGNPFYSFNINLITDGSGSYDYTNVRIKEGINSKLLFKLNSGQDNVYPSISEYYSVRLVNSNGVSETHIINKDFYFTESDILLTCKNMALKSTYDFVYCGGTKRIPNIKNMYFRVYEDQYYTGLNNEYLLDSSNKLYIYSPAPDNSYEVYKTISFTSKYIEEYSRTGNYEEMTVKTDYQGRILETIDSYRRKEVNEFDAYGNLLSTTIAAEQDFTSENKVIVGKPRLYSKNIYNDDRDGGKYREFIINSSSEDLDFEMKINNKTTNMESLKMGDNYNINFNYDILNRIKEIFVNYDYNKYIKNHFEYNSSGKLERVSEGFGFDYLLMYDDYGNINSYNFERLGEVVNIKTKETKPNISIYGGNINSERNNFTSSKIETLNDKYGRPREVIISDNSSVKSVKINYQEQYSNINSSDYQSGIEESPSISKIKTIQDECDGSITNYFFDDDNEISGYSVTKNNSEILKIQQLDSVSTKYIMGDTVFRTRIIENGSAFNSRVSRTEISTDESPKDLWDIPLNKFSFTYGYDNVFGLVTSKANENSNVQMSYLKTDGSTYISDKIQSLKHVINGKTYQYKYCYDDNKNLKKIISDYYGSNQIYLSYDGLNRLKSESNQVLNLDLVYSYLNSENKDNNRITKVISGITKVKEFTYDNLKRLTNYYKNGIINTKLEYAGFNPCPYIITKNNVSYYCTWDRDNLLTKYGNNYYTYNYQDIRVSKKVGTLTIDYLCDGNKILGENRSNGVKLRYMYDLMGICGVRYIASNGTVYDYEFVKDGLGNVVAIIKDGIVIVDYYYDAWGNFQENIHISTDPYAKINPIRWKSHYYDLESGMYHIEGRYYSPELYCYIDADSIENIITDSMMIGGLNPYRISGDNPNNAIEGSYNVLTDIALSPDPNYDPTIGYTWWEKNWKKVIRYGLFAITMITSIVLICIPGTQAFGIGMFNAGLGSAISGMLIGGLISGLVSFAQGNRFFTGFVDGAITGFVDGFTAGALLFCLSSAVNSVSSCIDHRHCFVAGTLILTEFGYKAIEDIELGEKVWSWCEETGEKILNKVTTLFENTTNSLVHLCIAGEEIVTTLGHPFYVVDYGWKNASELTTKDKIILYDNTETFIDSICIQHSVNETKVYNFEVENAHTYYVTNKCILVHNLCAEGRAVAKAKKAGIDVRYADDMADDFSKESKDIIQNLTKTSDGATVSKHELGSRIHKGFMENNHRTFIHKETNRLIKVDGIIDDTIFELKPNNARNIRKAIKQLQHYKKGIPQVKNMVLVLY